MARDHPEEGKSRSLGRSPVLFPVPQRVNTDAEGLGEPRLSQACELPQGPDIAPVAELSADHSFPFSAGEGAAKFGADQVFGSFYVDDADQAATDRSDRQVSVFIETVFEVGGLKVISGPLKELKETGRHVGPAGAGTTRVGRPRESASIRSSPGRQRRDGNRACKCHLLL